MCDCALWHWRKIIVVPEDRRGQQQQVLDRLKYLTFKFLSWNHDGSYDVIPPSTQTHGNYHDRIRIQLSHLTYLYVQSNHSILRGTAALLPLVVRDEHWRQKLCTPSSPADSVTKSMPVWCDAIVLHHEWELSLTVKWTVRVLRWE